MKGVPSDRIKLMCVAALYAACVTACVCPQPRQQPLESTARAFSLERQCPIVGCAVSRTGDPLHSEFLSLKTPHAPLQIDDIEVELHRYGGSQYLLEETDFVVLTRKKGANTILDTLCITIRFGYDGDFFAPKIQPIEDLLLISFSDGEHGRTIVVSRDGALFDFKGDLLYIDAQQRKLFLLTFDGPAWATTEGIVVDLQSMSQSGTFDTEGGEQNELDEFVPPTIIVPISESNEQYTFRRFEWKVPYSKVHSPRLLDAQDCSHKDLELERLKEMAGQ